MALRDINESIMLQLARSYVSPEGLRKELEAEPRLAFFVQDFESVYLQLDAAIQGADAARGAKIEGVKGTQTSIEAQLDRVARQMAGALQVARHSKDPDVIRAADALEPVLFRRGLRVNRLRLETKVAEAFYADAALQPALRGLMPLINCPDGTLDVLHEERLELAEGLRAAMQRLHTLELDENVTHGIFDARMAFTRTVRALEATLDLSGASPTLKAKLLGAVHASAEAAGADRMRRRSAAVVDGGETPSVSEDGDGDTSDLGQQASPVGSLQTADPVPAPEPPTAS